MAPYHGWLYGQGPDGDLYEIINQARTAAYLKNPNLALPSGLSVCDVLDFGGCEAYAYEPPCTGGPAYIDLPGITGNYLSVPDAASLDITANITLIVDVAMDDWTPATTQTLIAKAATGSNFSYSLSLTTGGQLKFEWTISGTSVNAITSPAGLNLLMNGERRSLRVDFFSSTGGQRQCRFFTAAAYDKTYVQLGGAAGTSTGVATSIFSGTSPVTIGQQTLTDQPLAGRVFYAQIRNSASTTPTLAGTAVLTVDPAAITTLDATSFLATTGQTVTINRAIVQAPSVPAHLNYPGALSNNATVPVNGMAADANTDCRVEVVRPTIPSATLRPLAGPYHFQFSTTGIFASQQMSDNTTISTPSTTYAALDTAGLAPAGSRIQLRSTWDATTDTLSWFWRNQSLGLPLDDNTNWTAGTSLVSAGKAANTAVINQSLGGSTSGTLWSGDWFRMLIYANGALWRDVNLATDAPADVNASSFTATTGQTVTINRSGSPSLQIVPFTAGRIDYTYPQTTIGLGPTTWQPVTYFSPKYDPAPWYDENHPESENAFGFFVEEWTGLDSAHVIRPVQRAGPFRSRLGALAAKERVMKLNVLLIGGTEQAVEYLFRWLDTTLQNVCAGCDTDAMYIRRFCPTGSDKGAGVGELREVGLSEGVTWESDPFEGTGKCTIRRVSFALTAGDPCIYVNGTTSAVEAQLENEASCIVANVPSASRLPCRPTCQELSPTCRNIFTYDINPLGAAAPVVSMVNDNNDWSMPVRALCYYNPNEISPTLTGTCGMPLLCEIYVNPLPPWSTLTWDVASRQVTYLDHSTSVPVSGWAFVDANDPPVPRYAAAPCGRGHVVIEPASLCLYSVNSHWFYLSTDLGLTPHFPTISVVVQERLGCG